MRRAPVGHHEVRDGTLERLNVRLYWITAGPATEEINPETFDQLPGSP